MSFNRIGMQGSDDLFLKNRGMTDPDVRLVPQNPIAGSEIRDRLSIQEQFGDDRLNVLVFLIRSYHGCKPLWLRY